MDCDLSYIRSTYADCEECIQEMARQFTLTGRYFDESIVTYSVVYCAICMKKLCGLIARKGQCWMGNWCMRCVRKHQHSGEVSNRRSAHLFNSWQIALPHSSKTYVENPTNKVE